MPSSNFRHRRWWRASAAILAASSLSLRGYSQDAPKPSAPHHTPVTATSGNKPGKIDYQLDIHAIFAAHCLTCHNAEKRSGGLSLGTYADIIAGGRSGAAIKPGRSGESLVVRRILGEVLPAMPLGGDPLPADRNRYPARMDRRRRPRHTDVGRGQGPLGTAAGLDRARHSARDLGRVDRAARPFHRRLFEEARRGPAGSCGFGRIRAARVPRFLGAASRA